MPDTPWPDLSLDDAIMPLEELDRRCSLTDRWPDWRVLCQTYFWLTNEDDFLPLDAIDLPDLADLLVHLRSNAALLHAQAAVDETFALSSAMRWAYNELNVLPVADLHPLAWLETLPLVREIMSRIADALGDVA